MLFIEINPKEKYYSVSPSFGCFNEDELRFIEQTLVDIWSVPYDMLNEKDVDLPFD